MATPFRRLPLFLALALLLLPAALAVSVDVRAAGGKAQFKNASKYSGWVKEMKRAPKGPFKRIRWYCADGTVHPPKAYACAKRGGGI
ncbi:MAG: hypothetical protein JRH10_16330, partial [Deltaproteobacteria bacterium]|nr:hypothetical protein [Deltaproteobacteria bacterium]